MPQFLVKAVNERGHPLEQVEHGDSEAEVRERLLQQGFLVHSVRARQHRFGGSPRIPEEEFLIFNQQFVTLIRAGLPILKALELLEKRARHPKLKELLGSIFARVKAGDLLSRAFRASNAVPEIFATTVMAGERSGNLDEVLTRYIQYSRMALSIKKKLRASLVYPAVLMTMVVVVLAFLVTYVVPKFGQMYAALGEKLPGLTVFMLHLGDAARHYILLLPVLVAAAVLAIKVLGATQRMKRWVNGALLRLPKLGDLWWKYQAALLCRTLGTLLLGGIPLVQALETASSALRSHRLSEGMRATAQEVREGRPLAEGLNHHRVLPPLAVEMVEVGESSGALPQMLASVAEFYDEDLSNSVATLLSLIEPAILIVVGSVVAVILISLYLPIFSMGSNMR